LSLAQGGYFLATGLWPLFHIRSFEAITGPKNDRWLVKTVGVLVTVIGTCLVVAGIRQEQTSTVFVVALASALGLAGVDVWYVFRKVIAPIYLLDAIVEVSLAAMWLVGAY
jgi:hypothetical protein